MAARVVSTLSSPMRIPHRALSNGCSPLRCCNTALLGEALAIGKLRNHTHVPASTLAVLSDTRTQQTSRHSGCGESLRIVYPLKWSSPQRSRIELGRSMFESAQSGDPSQRNNAEWKPHGSTVYKPKPWLSCRLGYHHHLSGVPASFFVLWFSARHGHVQVTGE